MILVIDCNNKYGNLLILTIFWSFNINITCLLARTKMGTEAKRASPSNDLISLTTTD